MGTPRGDEDVNSGVKEHYAQHAGKVDLWGNIENYTFYDHHGISHT